MKIIYFSWLKETLGISEENVSPPANIKNIDNLIKWLSAKSMKHRKVFLKSKVFVVRLIVKLPIKTVK